MQHDNPIFARAGISLVCGMAFTVMMLVSAGWDVRYRRIPNALSLVIFALGAGFAATLIDPRHAALRVLGGAATGCAVWFPFWALGMMGAGDVKFFAAASAWLGSQLAIVAALVTALFGGALALCWLFWRARGGDASRAAFGRSDVIEAGRNDNGDNSGHQEDARRLSATLPYGVAMATGLATSAWYFHVFH
jgi:prepilin peptidase CpaA